MMGEVQKFPVPAAPAVSFWEVVREKALVMMGLALLGVSSLYLMEYLRPDRDNAAMSLVIVAAFSGILAYLKSEQSHLIMNSRMTEWMQNSEKVAEARGYALAVGDLELKRLQGLEHTADAAERLVEHAADAAERLVENSSEARLEQVEQAVVNIEAVKALETTRLEASAPDPPLKMSGLTLTGTVKGTVEGDVKEKNENKN